MKEEAKEALKLMFIDYNLGRISIDEIIERILKNGTLKNFMQKGGANV